MGFSRDKGVFAGQLIRLPGNYYFYKAYVLRGVSRRNLNLSLGALGCEDYVLLSRGNRPAETSTRPAKTLTCGNTTKNCPAETLFGVSFD
jgi:hypothetical protein